jgi:glycerophosphoryl diester phosphodiesterase
MLKTKRNGHTRQRKIHVMIYPPYHLLQYRHSGDLTIIAHRGASAHYPENTMISFEGAINMGADMVELDVQMTADGEVIVFHDETLNRCTNGRGKIADYSLSDLKKLDAGSWFDGFFQGEKIPTLEEVLRACKNRIAVNIEIKDSAVRNTLEGGIEEKCLELVEKTGISGHVVFSSFSPLALRHIRQIDPKMPIAVLFDRKYYGAKLPSEIVSGLSANAFNCSLRQLNKKWLADLQQQDIPVNVYTVNDEKNMRRLLDVGINGIFTNHVDVLKKIREIFRGKGTAALQKPGIG